MVKSKNVPTYKRMLKNICIGTRNEKEIDELVAVMKSLGYVWLEDAKQFKNLEINHYVGVDDLDLFTARSFKKYHKIISLGWKNYSLLIKKMDKKESVSKD